MKKLFIFTYMLIVLVFFVTLIVMGQSDFFSTDKLEEESIKEEIKTTSYLLNEIALSHDQEYAEQILENKILKDQFKLTLYEREDPALNVELRERILKDKVIIENSDELLAYFTFGNEKNIYQVQIDLDSPLWDKDNRAEMLIMIEIFSALAVITFVILLILSRRLLYLEKVCIAFADGDLNVRASTGLFYQVGNLNSTLNFMAERISQLIRSNRNLTNAVAHEFRTPLFRIQCNLDMLDDSSVRPDQMLYLEGMQGDLNELSSMVEELLHFAKMERLDTSLIFVDTDLHTILEAQIGHLQFETDKKLILETNRQFTVPISVRPFQRALSNIIRNAYRYAQSEVRISLHKSNSELRICIENDGPAIPHQERETIFEPFIRLEKARDRESGGHGLGLAIVKQIVKQHKGTIYITDGSIGPCFNIILPLIHP